MALTPEQMAEMKEILIKTGGSREKSINDRHIPQDLLDFLDTVTRERIVVPTEIGIPVKIIISTSKNKVDNCPVHINMHGGGWIFPQNEDDDIYCAHIASRIRGITVDIDYALSFDHPFPVPFEQCYDVVKWTFEQCSRWSADPKRVSIGGHSAGGSMAAGISLKAAVTKDFQTCLQILDYAALDNFSLLDSGNERMRALSTLYSGGDFETLKHPYCSPVYAADEMLTDQPRTLIITAGQDSLKPYEEAYAMRLATLGTEVTVKAFMNSPHAFTARYFGEWREANELIVRYINQSAL